MLYICIILKIKDQNFWKCLLYFRLYCIPSKIGRFDRWVDEWVDR